MTMTIYKNNRNNFSVLISLLVCSYLSLNCYSVTVISPTETKVERGVGVVKINMNADANSFFTELKGVGFASTPMGTSIGFMRHEFAVVNDSCKLIVWIENKQEIDNLKELIGDTENICTLNNYK